MSCPSKTPVRVAVWLTAPLCVFLLLILLLPSVTFSVTPEPPARPSNYVVDLAEIVSPEVEAQLNAYLKELDQKTSAQMMVLTILSLDGEDIAGFALSIAEKWKPGQKGKDNGVLLVVALQDKKYRIEVGYGLEGTLPDSLVGSVGREYLVPYFKRNDYGAGILSASTEIIRIIAAQQGVELSGVPQPPRLQQPQAAKTASLPPFFYFILALFVLFPVIAYGLYKWQQWKSGEMRLPRSASTTSGGYGSGRSTSGYWSGGGGFGGSSSGSDSGGFGGGGGGDFGGGGASGDW